METINDALEINGSLDVLGTQDEPQLEVQGVASQTTPLQVWEQSDGGALAQITGDGRLELGDLDLGTPDALVEANRDITLPDTVTPRRGVQSTGKVTGNGTNVIDGAIAWAVHELEVLGDAVVTGIHAALRSRVTRKNTSASPQAELRAADFEAINDTASGANSAGKLVGVQSAVTNEQGASLTEAVGVAVKISDDNTSAHIADVYGLRIDDLPVGSGATYAIHTGEGSAHIGDDLEVKVFDDPPIENPPGGFVKVYPKLDVGNPKLYAKDSDGYEHVLSGDVEKYSARVKNTRPANLLAYWQLNESVGSSSVIDSSGNGHEGTVMNGASLGVVGIGDGETAASFDGSDDNIDVYGAELASAFNGAAGTLLVWAKASAGSWLDGDVNWVARFYTNWVNEVQIYITTNNLLYWHYEAGGSQKLVTKATTTTDWMCLALTWDHAAGTSGEVKAYFNGVQEGTTKTLLGTWTGALARADIGSGGGGTSAWDGRLAHVALWNVALSAAEINSLAKVHIEWGVQGANTVFAGPTDWGAGSSPTFRALVADDVPSLTAAKVSDFDAEVSNNTDVAANTAHRQVISGNPHNVNASDVGNAVAQWNANKLQGRTVTNTAPNDGQMLKWNNLAAQWEPSGNAPQHYRSHAPVVRRVDNGNLAVLHGVMEVNRSEVAIAPITLDMATAADWLEGSSQEAANQMVYGYLNAAGSLKLSNRAPVYPRADLNSMAFAALVNQAGWNGTASQGLNATSVGYDGDSGEANLKAGMWIGVCASDDTDYSKWRGTGSGSVGGKSVPGQYAFIEAVNTTTNTLTLRTGHNIAINDNDRLFAISGTPQYRYESSQWWRCIGALWNDGSQNLAEGLNGYTSYELENAGANYDKTGTTFTAVDATKLALRHVNLGAGVEVGFHGTARNITASYSVHFTVEVDGILLGGSNGVVRVYDSPMPVAFNRYLPHLAPGMHTYRLMFRVNAGTGRLFAGADGGQFWVKEC